MSLDSLVFLVLVLFVWGLSVAARWFQEQMNKYSTDGLDLEPIDWSPSPEWESLPPADLVAVPVETHQPRRSIPERKTTVTHKKTAKKFGLDRPQTLRQGVILMTVLGPCRALEPSNNSSAF